MKSTPASRGLPSDVKESASLLEYIGLNCRQGDDKGAHWSFRTTDSSLSCYICGESAHQSWSSKAPSTFINFWCSKLAYAQVLKPEDGLKRFLSVSVFQRHRQHAKGLLQSSLCSGCLWLQLELRAWLASISWAWFFSWCESAINSLQLVELHRCKSRNCSLLLSLMHFIVLLCYCVGFAQAEGNYFL